MEDDYLLGDDSELDEIGYYQNNDDESEEEEELEGIDEDEANSKRVSKKGAETGLTTDEMWLISSYDDIVAAGKNNKDNALEDAATIIVMANPKHTAQYTIGNIIKEMFHKQGHSRMVNSIYVPDTPLRGEDIDIDWGGDDDSGFNRTFTREAREQIAKFIGYLASRDLSKDSIISRRRKQRQIPAFIIFLFTSGMYDLIIDCPTMPEVYAVQIHDAMEKIMKSKYDIVEELARRYEEAGRPKVADRVRKLQLAWFTREPAEIRTNSEFADLELTYDDVVIYREYRSRYTNTSKALTQDVISDYISVYVGDGMYEKLKDKTRAEAINDAKQVYKEWARATSGDTEISKQVIWNEVN